jgi:helix-turn-helix resolvase-like protein
MARPGVKSRWTKAEIARVVAMLDNGITQKDIAKFFNTSQQSISRLAAKIEAFRQSADNGGVTAETWDAIVADAAAWMRQHDNSLGALIGITQAYEAKVTSGPIGVPRKDWDELIDQRDNIILPAWRAFHGASK